MRPNDVLKDVLAHVRIHRTQCVVRQVDVTVLVDGPRQADPLPLSSTQTDTLHRENRQEVRQGDRGDGQEVMQEVRQEARGRKLEGENFTN